MNENTENNLNKILNQIYYDPSQGLISQEKFFVKVKKIIPSITRKEIANFLHNQEVFQQHKFVPQNHKAYYPIYHNANKPFSRIQIDLMDISAEPKCRAKYIFNCIDIYTRYLISVPIKNKSQSECVRGIIAVLNFTKSHKFKIVRLDSDSESSFKSKEFQKILKQNNIEHHLVEIGDKQGVAYAERVNGTLRNMIEKYKSSHNRYNLDSVILKLVENYNNTLQSSHNRYNLDSVIPKLVENYNNTLHSITKSTPIEALKNTQEYHQMVKQHKAVRRVKRRINKEGLDEKNIIKDVNERSLRKYRQTRGINLNEYL